MNVLSIGNSFSQDAQRYLYGIARADGVYMRTVNLMIGGCSLARHYRNMLSGDRAYTLEQNGVSTNFPVALGEALLSDNFDVVTLQQLSSDAPRIETYRPYLAELVAYVRKCQPKAKIYLQETWAYERESHRLTKELGYATENEMTADLQNAYLTAAASLNLTGVIPSGTVFAAARAMGADKLHRDTFHASLGLGRYLLGLTWYRKLTGRPVISNSFRDFDAPVSEEEIALAQNAVAKILP